MTGSVNDLQDESSGLIHGADDRFVEYYRDKGESADTLLRSQSMFDILCRIRADRGFSTESLSVADIGCGPGAQSVYWAQRGHSVHGLDVNADLIQIATHRAEEAGLSIDFRVGTASSLPWADESVDICLAPELLEHVPEWRECLDEFARVLRPRGLLYINTSNKLCPIQNEFDLPLYSWYPARLKRRCEKLAVTTKPQFANYATYPAVNWFTYYGLRREFRNRGLDSMDRSDLMQLKAERTFQRIAIAAIRTVPPLRLLLQLLTPYTLIIGIKHGSSHPDDA